MYATLARLARDGKAIAGWQKPGAGPDRKRYTITETGKYEVETWLGEPIPPEPYLQSDLFVNVVLVLMLGRPGGGVPRRPACRAPRSDARAHRAQATRQPGDALLADHGLFHLEADLRWIDLTEARDSRY